jgi:hypothetical protein
MTGGAPGPAWVQTRISVMGLLQHSSLLLQNAPVAKAYATCCALQTFR